MVLYDGDHGFLSVKLRDCQFFSGTQFVPTGLHWYPLWLFTWSFGYSSTTSDGSPYEKRVNAKGRVLSDECIADEVPFEIPDSWEWVRLESVATYIQRGKSPKYSVIEKYPVVAQKCNQWSGFSLEKAKFVDPETVCKYGNERILRDGDLLWNSTGLGTLGRMAIYDSSKNEYGWAVADSHVTVIRTCKDWLDYRFAFAYFAGPTVQLVIEDQASGSTKQKELAQETVKSYLIPIPPLAEQRRIVERVNELMPLVGEYGKLEDAREELDATLPGRLRKSVLQMAVQGKLVSQDPGDEPASVLLERIREQRRQLAAEKKMKATKGGESVIFTGSDGRRYEKRVDAKGRESEPVCIEDEIPFKIPASWEWARLESVCSLIRGSGIKRADVMADGLPCVRYGELYTTYETSIVDVASLTSKEIFDVSKKLEPDEVLVTLTGENDIDIGRAVYNASGSVLAFGGDLLALKGRKVRGDYLAMAINSSAVGSQRTKASTGNIIVHLSAAKVSRFLVPLPPLAEQACIVEQFETLLSIIA